MNKDYKVILGNSPDEMKELKESSIDMIYMDPPFFTQKKRKLKKRYSNKEYSYSDKWPEIKEYLNWVKDMLTESKRLLKDDGAIFFHCDYNASHHIRVLLDDVFGKNNFRNDIIWSYKRWTNPGSFLQRTHDTIYFYAMSDKTEINELYEPYSETTNLDQIWQKRTNGNDGRSKYDEVEGKYRCLGKTKKGVRMRDVWDIPILNPKAKERCGYPTQKPVELLERIIFLSTEKNDTILDPCCGSGTTLVAGLIHERKVVGIDKEKDAVEITKKRLEDPIITRSKVTNKGRKYFKKPINKKSSHMRYLLEMIGASEVYRNKYLEGFLRETPFDKPVGIMLLSEEENYDKKKKGFVDDLKRTKTPYGIIIIEDSQDSSLRYDKLDMFENFNGGNDETVNCIEVYEHDIIKNPDICNEKLSELE